MTILQSIIMGIIQGLSEFLPISSTAHLLIGQQLMGIKPGADIFAFLIIVQLGTILSLLVFFGRDLWQIIKSVILNLSSLFKFKTLPLEARLGWYILLATIPALLVGFLLRHLVKQLFNSPLLEASIRLLAAALVMTLAEWLGKRTRQVESMTWLDALFIGVMQVIAVFPGASRSGTTISAGLLRNFDRPSAARFAFLLSIPVLLAAGGYEMLSLLKTPGLSSFMSILLAGLLSAALVGWLAVRWFMGYLSKHSLKWFIVYCLVVGLVCLVFFLV